MKSFWKGSLILLVALLFALPAFAFHAKQTFVRIGATCGEALTTGSVVAIKDADGKAYKADADDATLRPAVGIVGLGCASGGSAEIITYGRITGWTSLSEGTYGYLSETAGLATQVAPAWAQPIGFAVSTTDYLVNFGNYFDSASLTALGVQTQSTVYEGATANDFETTLAVVDPTADRTITLPDLSGTALLSTAASTAAASITGVANGFEFEGATADAFETTVSVTDPTADRSIVVPDAPGTVMLSSLATNGVDAANAVTGASNGLVYEGATADAFETTVSVVDPTVDRAVSIPNAPGTVDLLSAASHDYAGAAVDWTLSVAENQAGFITVTNANGAINALLPAAVGGKIRAIYNNSGQTLTFKVTGGTGGTVATGKYALYADNGTDVFEIYEQP